MSNKITVIDTKYNRTYQFTEAQWARVQSRPKAKARYLRQEEVAAVPVPPPVAVDEPAEPSPVVEKVVEKATEEVTADVATEAQKEDAKPAPKRRTRKTATAKTTSKRTKKKD